MLAIAAVLAPLAAAIPLCCLSAVLFVVAWNMSELPHLIRLVRTAPTTDVVVLLRKETMSNLEVRENDEAIGGDLEKRNLHTRLGFAFTYTESSRP